MEWSKDVTLKLINEYKKRRPLWDNKNEEYRVMSTKFEAWRELADIFECEVTDVKRKMNSLTASYRRERKKLQQGHKKSHWFAFDAIRCLYGHEEPQKMDTLPDIPDTNEQSSSGSAIEDNVIDTPVKKELELPKPTKRPNLASERCSDKTKREQMKEKGTDMKRWKQSKRRLSSSDDDFGTDNDKIIQALRAFRRSEMKKRDECDIFGEYIANSLKKHDLKTRSMIKHAINNIIFESEMKMYNQRLQERSHDENPLILTVEHSDKLELDQYHIENS